jgi:Fe2+ or Zn2+ uptake regulation protein
MHGQRNSFVLPTHVRKTVVSAVLSYPKPKFAARELVESMVVEAATVSVASGYRVLRELQEAGILAREEARYGRVWYRLNI